LTITVRNIVSLVEIEKSLFQEEVKQESLSEMWPQSKEEGGAGLAITHFRVSYKGTLFSI
jgi:Zn-dependent M32 family carboxypeptidase